EVDLVKKELYDLYLLLVQAQQQNAQPAVAQENLKLLEKAEQLRTPSRSYYRFRAQAHRRLGQEKRSAEDEQRAADAKTPETSLDHFLLAEQYRKEAAGMSRGEAKQKAGKADVPLTDRAIAEYREALRIDPKHYWSHLQLGRCHLSVE